MRLAWLAAGVAAALAGAAAAAPYGTIGKIVAKPGQREALVAALSEGSGAMPGNRAYIVARDAKDPDVIWITESWDSKEAHAASLQLPQVRAAIRKGMPLIAGFETIAEVEPVGR